MTSTASDKPILAVLKGERRDPPPIWLMRQAGRYLPEYRALRAEKGGFLELVMDSGAAVEITMQPIRRFGMDGAILFSDILIVPMALGQKLWFETGEGPRLAPCVDGAGVLDGLTRDMSVFDPIYATVRGVRAALPEGVTLLGFAGAPWTVATYMVAGEGSRDQGAARMLAYRDPAAMQAIIDAIVDVTIDYLLGQIEAGAEAVQLFESWAGTLSPAQFEQWVIAPNARIAAAIHERAPGVPVIGFPKGAGGKLAAFASATGVDAIGIDETVDPEWAHSVLPAGMPVQGNLDPLVLVSGGEALLAAADRIRRAFASRPHIFNLGHGIVPEAPIAHVEALLERVRGATGR